MPRLCKFLFILLTLGFSWSSLAGELDVMATQEGLPVPGYTINIDRKKIATNEVGFINLSLDSGVHSVEFANKNGETKSVDVRIVDGERTQIVINLLEEIQVDLLEPRFEKQTLGKKKGHLPTEKVEFRVESTLGAPVSDARVFAQGLDVAGRTNSRGLVVLDLPIGTVNLSMVHPDYSTENVRGLKIEKGRRIQKKVTMTPSGLVLEDFIVLAPSSNGSIEALIEVRRKASEVADVMSAEQMSKSGDSDAAGSLRRVTGLTLKDGKYVYVRGLGERYSSTLLNGVSLPSPDPSRRVIPLDLFPVQFLDSMVVQKSYSPDMPGSFGGGTVMLKTQSMPKKFFAKLATSQSHNSNVSTVPTYRSGSSDWLGVDDGGRKLPDAVALGGNPNQLLENNRHQLRNEGAETLPELSFSVGDRWRSRYLNVGYTVSGVYKDLLNSVTQERRLWISPNGSLIPVEENTRAKSTKERVVGGIAGLNFQFFKKHSVDVSHINIRNTTDYVAIVDGRDENNQPYRQTEREWAARTLNTTLLQGESEFPLLNSLKVKWHWADSRARRDEPSRTMDRYSPNNTDGTYIYDITDNTAYERRFYDLQERAGDRGVQLSGVLPWFYGRQARVSFGIGESTKERSSSMGRYGLDPTGTPCSADMSQSLDKILPECRSAVELRDFTQRTDNYGARQKVQSYMVASQWPLLKSLTLSTGARFEKSVQMVNTFSPSSSDTLLSELTTRDWLPGNSLTWRFNKSMQIRLAASETISRPDLRELSDTLWQDFETGFDINGNPDLKATVIKSYDARWEWYFGRRENISFGVFHKDFQNPIEQEFRSGSDPTIRFVNAEGANMYGAEIEFAKNLSFVSSSLSAFTFSGNYAFIFSNINLGQRPDSLARDSNRPLQGQSEYTANFLLDYGSETHRLNMSLAFNIYGRRIAYLSPDELPAVWEEPRPQLDFIFSKGIGKNIKINGKIRNLTNSKSLFKQGGRVAQSRPLGTIYTLGLSMEI